jgi:hypothetical protein
MNNFSRRAFLGVSLGAAAAVRQTTPALAAPQCVTGSLPGFLPTRLSVDCASRMNFRLFRKNPGYLGLAGVVSMTFVRGGQASYNAGNLFLFPWLKPKGAARGIAWPSVAPVDATQYVQASPIPNENLPVDEYFCRVVLQAPWSAFIGFALEASAAPAKNSPPEPVWATKLDKLADGAPVGIDWTSSNLNRSWFGGSSWIPADETCNGAAWRKVIVDGLNQASVAAC